MFGLATCGGGDDENVEGLLDRAFQNLPASMDVKLEAELVGFDGTDKPLRIRAAGPYRTGDGELPSLDIDLEANPSGAQPVSLGVVSAEGRLFIKFEDTAYELPQPEQDSGGSNPCSEKGLRIDPRPWVENAESEGDEKVAGVETTHASGTLDSDQMLRDLNRFISRCGALLGATGANFEALSAKQIDEAARELGDPHFDVYVGKDDEIIRRLSAAIDIKPRADGEDEPDPRPLSIKFSIEFGNVNGGQTVEVPARSRPLADLTSQLGVDALGNGLGLESEQQDQPESTDEEQQPAVDAFQAYADCLDQLDPDDTEGLERCSALLNEP